MTTAVQIEKLGKQYTIGPREPYHALRDRLANALAAPWRLLRGRSNGLAHSNGNAAGESKTRIWALRNVSLEIPEGQAMGLIGRNGAGKTTLLKILARITRPTEGQARVYGRIGSLLEIGTGFHGELTGNENLYLSGALLGMRRSEIRRRFDEIVAFSGVEKFLDTPLKHYSTGMQTRLAFAVAAHLDPEILLVDEVLAVGDLEFQKKCMGKMEQVSRSGRTVVFVSHNMGAIRGLCTRAVWLDQGRVRRVGAAGECIDAYAGSFGHGDPAGGRMEVSARTDRAGGSKARFTTVTVLGSDGQPHREIEFGEPFAIELEVDCRKKLLSAFLSLAILSSDGTSLMGSHQYDSTELRTLEAGRRYRLRCHFDRNELSPGIYILQIGLLDYSTWDAYDWMYSAGEFTVTAGTGKFGRSPDDRPTLMQPALRWTWQ